MLDFVRLLRIPWKRRRALPRPLQLHEDFWLELSRYMQHLDSLSPSGSCEGVPASIIFLCETKAMESRLQKIALSLGFSKHLIVAA